MWVFCFFSLMPIFNQKFRDGQTQLIQLPLQLFQRLFIGLQPGFFALDVAGVGG